MEQEFVDNVLRGLGKELEQNPRKIWMFLSFADNDGFKGGAIVKAHGIIDASLTTHRMKINPGGQMACNPIPDRELPPEEYRNRLLTKKDLDEIWPDDVVVN